MNPLGLNDYRPISLVGCLYKIISKILARRMKVVMPDIIEEHQSAFVGGRNLLDGVVVANEVVDDAKRSRKSCCLFKIDFEKAYDSVNWSFLYYMLGRMGFPKRWVKWIKGCVESASISVLVNGSPTNEFQMERGLRQGDPIAPFLFLIVAEGLGGLMRAAVHQNLFTGYKIGEVVVSHIQYADDTLLIGDASLQNALTMKSILMWFELVSGLKVNFYKSKIAGVGCRDEVIQVLAEKLNCKTMRVPFVYLGVEVGANPRRAVTWEPIMQKLKKRLTPWKMKHLSFGGRLCLLNSRRFLWGESDEGRRISWVKWDDVCRPKSEGGVAWGEVCGEVQ